MTLRTDMADYLQAWQCIGCGRVEAPQTCLGVCQDRKVFLIGKAAHEQALAEAARLRALLATTAAKLARFAQCTPHADRHEEAFVALQAEVRELRAALERELSDPE
jgi:hypothetical protein